MNVKAIRLSEKTDPDLLRFVESFESSVHDWKFREEEGSEGEEFDGEGWNLKFWKDRETREQRTKEERIQRRAMERIGRMGATLGRTPSNRNQDMYHSRMSPERINQY
jgi:hypothetical protein